MDMTLTNEADHNTQLVYLANRIKRNECLVLALAAAPYSVPGLGASGAVWVQKIPIIIRMLGGSTATPASTAFACMPVVHCDAS